MKTTIHQILSKSLAIILVTSAIWCASGQSGPALGTTPKFRQQADKKVAPATGNVHGNSISSTGTKVKQPTSVEQLRLERKQAIDKGLSTAEYDHAIKEFNQNQTK